jgi:hypothetical protein
MLILIHVLIAIGSLGYAFYSAVVPSQSRLYRSYGLAGLTLASGTYLVITRPGHLAQTCSTGVVYLVIMLTAADFARRRLAAATNR